jgi:hypothetical protein
VLAGAGEHLAHGEVRDQSAIIIAAGKRGGRTLHDTDDLELLALNLNPLSDGIEVGKPGGLDGLSHHDHGEVMTVLDIGKEAPKLHLDAAERVALLGSADLDAEDFVPFVACLAHLPEVGIEVGAGVLHRRAALRY